MFKIKNPGSAIPPNKHMVEHVGNQVADRESYKKKQKVLLRSSTSRLIQTMP